MLNILICCYRSDDVFLSLSIISDDISMVLDARDIDKFPEDSVYSSEAYWKVITIGDGPLGFGKNNYNHFVSIIIIYFLKFNPCGCH